MSRRLPLHFVTALLCISAPAAAQGGPPPEVQRVVSQVMAMLNSSDDAALTTFATEALAEPYRKSFTGDGLQKYLVALRDAARGHTNSVGLERTPDGLVIVLDGPRIQMKLDDRTMISGLTLAGATGPADRPNPPPIVSRPPTTQAEARPWHVRALVGLKDMDPDSALALFERSHFSAGYLGRTTHDERLALVRRIRQASLAASTIRVTEDDAGVHVRLDDGAGPDIRFTIEAAAPFGMATLVIQPGTQAAPATGPALAWDAVASRIREAEAAGLSGQVLVRHQGKELLRSSFGMVDRSANRKTAPDAVYCIGSAPIDFTITAARLLAERGKLDLDAPIGRYLPGVPADKATLTSRMIIEGRSGLANFHDTQDDWDADLAWIDRATALRRILSKPLLTAPGAERQNSHSAFGLLAAIIEIASGTTYPEFVRAEILRPLGMTRTGFYGETLGLPADAFATGYGAKSSGLPNIGPNWGPTSWLVMGSGGMVSTLDDLRRYYDGMARGALFADKKPSSSRGMSVNGSDRGFFFTRMDNGQGDQVFLMSNTETSPALRPLVDAFMGMVMRRGE